MSKNSDVLLFLGKVLLWMPVTFALWYFVVPGIAYITAYIAEFILQLLANHAIKSVEANGREIYVVSHFSSSSFPVKLMNYAYSFPFLLAMVLASPDSILGKVKKYALSLIPLFLIAIWGVSFGAIAVLAFYSNQEIAQQLHTTPTIRLIISLGWQLGKLIIPPLVAVILWLYLYRDYAHQLVPRLVSR
ncbi:MAG TPA: hypothetical protein EYH38_04945 [Leucothrix sp.]|nr:hypothetical protein [Leucothrix sp.]